MQNSPDCAKVVLLLLLLLDRCCSVVVPFKQPPSRRSVEVISIFAAMIASCHSQLMCTTHHSAEPQADRQKGLAWSPSSSTTTSSSSSPVQLTSLFSSSSRAATLSHHRGRRRRIDRLRNANTQYLRDRRSRPEESFLLRGGACNLIHNSIHIERWRTSQQWTSWEEDD